MPIRPENRSRYPTNWKAISDRVRFERAAGRGECTGECGAEHGLDYHDGWVSGQSRCRRVHGKRAAVGGGKVVLTVAHLDHVPENVADTNLKAMCQACHLAHDKDHHQSNAKKTRARRVRA